MKSIKNYPGGGSMKNYPNLIDFFDSSQINFDILSTCVKALKYYSNLICDKDINSISITIEYATDNLSKLHSKLAKSIEGGKINEK